MGVTQLWQILAPVEQHLPLSSLEGQTLAVDLSIWVCENQCVKQMQGVVSKPYLRNLFFRISHLTQLGVKLVFVIEGSAPELKWDTMIKRQQTRFPGRQGKQPQQRPAGKQTRRNFNSWLKECCELLEILGIPYIQSKGEAEALCALLNAAGLVDGCLTNDGDAFLYGATTVYRNFTMNSKDPHVEMYRLSDIQAKLGVDRGGLVALGLLIGCDFVPKGVPGIGVANAVRLLQSLQGQDVLLRLQSWSSMSERDCIDQAEVLARRKAIQVPDFPQVNVIDEFLVAKDRCPSRLPQWKRPVPVKLQDFALIKLEWPVEYTMEKVLPLITLWDMQDLLTSKNPSVHQHLKPHRIVKTRIRQGEPCFEVEWIKPVTDTAHDGSYYVTIESQDLFSKCYPELVKGFFTKTTEQKKKPKAKKKKKKMDTAASAPPSLDNISFQFEKINIGEVTSQLQESAKVLHPSFNNYDETTLTTKAKQPRHLTLSPNSKKSNNKGESSVSRKLVVSPWSKSQEPVLVSVRDTEDEAVIPLSQRVKLRMQNKHGNNKENEDKPERIVSQARISDQKNNLVKSPTVDLSSMSSLLEDIQNLSLKEQEKFRQKQKEATSNNLSFSSPQTGFTKVTPSDVSKKFISAKDVQKISSPSTKTFCSPLTYLKHQGGIGDSFEIQKSPYYIENPWATSTAKSEKKVVDISSPGFFARPDTKKEPEKVDNRSEAEKLVEKLEAGINKVGGSNSRVHVDCISSSGKKAPTGISDGENLTVDSLMSILNSSEKPAGTPSTSLCNMKTATPGNQSISGLDSSSLSQFGDFQIQHSFLNSLCSSLVQALTPKGLTMTRAEYDKLVTTLNALDSDDNEMVDDNDDYDSSVQDDVVCNIDFSELENASKGLKNLNQKLLLRPIQIDDEDVMSKLSKSARKKLRRRERKREQELENLVQVQNRSMNCSGKRKHLVQGHSSKCQPIELSNLEKGTRIEEANNTNKKLNKEKRANEKGDKNLSGKLNGVRSQSDAKSSLKYDGNKVGNTNTKNMVKSDVSKTENTNSENSYKNARTENVNNNENQHDIVVEKLKKRRKKKKVRKASSVIDLSVDETMVDDKKVASCEDYLKKALENEQRKMSNKIVKASPFMDVSADDTLLELQELSCKIVGEDVHTEVHSKLKQKKKLSKEILNKEFQTIQTGKELFKPVLSINSMLESDVDRCGKQDVLEVDEIDVKNEITSGKEIMSVNGIKELKCLEVNGGAKLRKVHLDIQSEVQEKCTKQNHASTATAPENLEDAHLENEHLSKTNMSDNEAKESEEGITDSDKCRRKNYVDEVENGNAELNNEFENKLGNRIYATKLDSRNEEENCRYANERRNENYARERGDIPKLKNEETDKLVNVQLCSGFKSEGTKQENKRERENGDENHFLPSQNEDPVKYLEKGTRQQGRCCIDEVENTDTKNESAEEFKNGIRLLEKSDDYHNSKTDKTENENHYCSKRILSNENKKEDVPMVHVCSVGNKADISVSEAKFRVSDNESADFENGTDVINGKCENSNCHETSVTYHMMQRNGIDQNVETVVPDHSRSNVFRENLEQINNDSLVLKYDNNADIAVKNGNVFHILSESSCNNGIYENRDMMFEMKSVDNANADLYLSGEINGADMCNSICEKNKMKEDRKNGRNTDLGDFVDLLYSSEDEVDKLATTKNSFHNHADESKTELCIEQAETDINTQENDITKSEVFQSPACLADRLKMRLRKTSTRNVLNMFTNGN